MYTKHCYYSPPLLSHPSQLPALQVPFLCACVYILCWDPEGLTRAICMTKSLELSTGAW